MDIRTEPVRWGGSQEAARSSCETSKFYKGTLEFPTTHMVETCSLVHPGNGPSGFGWAQDPIHTALQRRLIMGGNLSKKSRNRSLR